MKKFQYFSPYTYDIKNEEYITGKDITNSKNLRLYIYICTYESHVTWKFEEDVKIGIRNGIMI